jgi:exodeoxyribonuclease VII small subunit
VPPDCPTFEQALESLELVVHELEEGQIGLADALSRYEQGVKLLKQCFGLLEDAERKIEQLSGFDSAGNPLTTPFDSESSLSRDEKRDGRSRRRSASQPSRDEAGGDSANMDAPRGLF